MNLTVLLGLLTAVSYGAADFFAAIASRRIKVVVVTAAASFSGLMLLLLLSPFMGASFSADTFFWGFTAGLFSVVALLALYASLAIGPISIVSPLGALVSAIVPALIGVGFLGESFNALGWLAIAIALLAVVLVGFIPGEHVEKPKLKALLLAILAGSAIGLAVSSLAQSPHDSGIGPIILMRATAAIGLTIIATVVFIRKRSLVAEASYSDQSSNSASASTPSKLDVKIWLTVAMAGFLDAAANILFTLASRTGSLTVVGVLTALYPLGTILLARIILKEHVARIQQVGIALTLVASTLLALA